MRLRNKSAIQNEIDDLQTKLRLLQTELLAYGKSDVPATGPLNWRYVPEHLQHELILIDPDGRERILSTTLV